MKHYIIAKLHDSSKREELVAPVQALFDRTLSIPGIHKVTVKPCCVDRANRYDLMIVIEMDPSALEAYDQCEPHKEWKQAYGSLLKEKTIFDSED